MFTVDMIFIEYPECRKYFYDGIPLPTEDPEMSRVWAIAELLLDQFDYLLLQQRWFPFLYPPHSWREYMMDSFAHSPSLCKYLELKKSWYSAELISTMRDAVDERDSRLQVHGRATWGAGQSPSP
jgi:hypothetical protein